MQFFILSISPLFFLLGLICFYLPEGHHMMHGEQHPLQFVSSMWFMYVVMGVAHMAPWIHKIFFNKKKFPYFE